MRIQKNGKNGKVPPVMKKSRVILYVRINTQFYCAVLFYYCLGKASLKK